MEKIKLNTIEEAIEDFRKGEFVIIVDDEDRENEGDLVVAAELITPEKVNFMLKHARGVLCAPITISRCEELDLPHQVSNNTSVLGTPFTVTIDKLEGCTTGVSAADRAATIRALADPTSKPETFGRPGHVNPLYAQEKGVLRRAGHTEACVDMARLAGLYPAAALMEVMNEDGTMARLPELKKMADEYGFKLISIADLIAYRLKQESLVEKGVEVDMPTEHGHFRLIPFRQKSNGLEHVALIKGTFSEDEPVLVRVHSSCATGDIFGSMRCDCGDQLHKAMEQIEKEAMYDGFYAVVTNLEGDVSEIIQINQQRWQIEENFRIMKEDLSSRPAFVRREDRIKAHFMTCYISLIVYRLLEKKIGKGFTCGQILQTLRSMQMTLLNTAGGYIPSYTRTELTDTLHQVFGFHTDYEILTKTSMQTIIKNTKIVNRTKK